MVVGPGGLGTHASNVESFNNVHGFQRRNALAVGRAFPAGNAPVVGGYCLVPVGRVVGQVFSGNPAAMFLDKRGHFFGDFASVKSLRASLGDGPQGFPQRGQAHHLAWFGSATVQQHLVTGRVLGQPACLPRPLVGDNVGRRKALFGVPDSWLHHLEEGHAAVNVQNGLPTVHRPGHRHRENTSVGHVAVALGL